MKFHIVLAVSALTVSSWAASESLIANGDFATTTGWHAPSTTISYPQDGENTFLRLQSTEPGQNVLIYRAIPLPPEVKALELSYRVRFEGIKPGEQPWFDGRIMMNFKDADKKTVGSPSAPSFRGTKAEWETRTQSFLVPEDATTLEFMPTLFQAQAGTLDFDDFQLKPIAPEIVRAQIAERAAKLRAKVTRSADQSIIANGDFESDQNGWVKAGDPNVRIETEDGNRFLRLESTEPGKMYSVYRAIPLTADDKAFELTCRARYSNIKVGSKSWFDGRIIINLKDAGKKVVGSPGPPVFKGTITDWKTVTRKFLVPDNAISLELMPTLFHASSGTLDIDDLQLKPIDPATVPKPVDMSSPVVAAPPVDKLPPELRVVGNELHTAAGQPVWLQGLSVDSLQWSATGDRIVTSIVVGIEQWKANCIRLAVTENFWFGRSDFQKDGGKRYRQVIDSAVNTAAARGAYLVIDLHRFRAPTRDHLEFWKEVAAQYKNHPAVMFDIFNEPHDITWEVWRNGGEVTDKVKRKEGVAVENKDELRRFQAVGMQELVEAIRAVGAKNIIIAGGLDWSYDISGILKGFALEDKTGNGIMYSTHVYPWKSDWQNKFLVVAEKHPLFLGEVGAIRAWEDFSFIGPSQRYPLEGWAEDVVALIQKHKLNWTAFSFHPTCGPPIITGWDYNPTPFWGVYVKRALGGEVFELKKLR
ncbi:MAG: hypothetical protein PCFJNLEI_01012 [Verrucomicrobiae bacterium]|nr:hypothetical protein [Verrucomicrobiae bacterium]